MKREIAALAVFAGTLATIPMAIAAMPPPESWEIGPWARGRNYSVGMPAHPDVAPGGGLTFVFPLQGRGEVDAMTTEIGPLSGARQITMRYRIDAARSTRFVPSETPDQTATVSLYFQQGGDNWGARGRYASYRWYSPIHGVVPLTPGVRTVTLRLGDTWTNVWGVPNTQDPRGFARALSDTARIGVAFGTSSARSHGVYATGLARFTLLSLDID